MKRFFFFIKNNVPKTRAEKWLWGPYNIFEDYDEMEEIDMNSGVYIIVSKTRKFTYPIKTSPVIYIGKAEHLRERLQRHVKLYKKACDSEVRKYQWIYSRYHYMSHGGAEVYIIHTRGLEKAKELESKIIEDFYDTYLSLPIGNGAFSYR